MTNVLVYKNPDNVCYLFIYKKQDTLSFAIFHENVEVGIYIQKASHFALGEFLYGKTSTLRKKQDNLRYVFIYKNPDTLRYAIFHWIFEIGGGGEDHFICKKQCTLRCIYICKKQCTLRYIYICKKQFTLSYVFIYKKPDTLRCIFICKKQCILRYVYI